MYELSKAADHGAGPQKLEPFPKCQSLRDAGRYKDLTECLGYFDPRPTNNFALGSTRTISGAESFSDPLLFCYNLQGLIDRKKPLGVLPDLLLRGEAKQWWVSLPIQRRNALTAGPQAGFFHELLLHFLPTGKKSSAWESKYTLRHAEQGMTLLTWVDMKLMYGRSCVMGGEKAILSFFLDWFDDDLQQIFADHASFLGRPEFKGRAECERFCRKMQNLLDEMYVVVKHKC